MRSIRGKIWVGMMILVGIIIALLWLLQIVFLDQYYSTLEINGIKQSTETILKDIEKLDDIERINQTESILDTLEKFINEKQLSIEILDQNFNIVYQSAYGNNQNIPGSIKDAFLEVSQNTMLGKSYQQETTHPKYGYDFLIMGEPIFKDRNIVGVMMVTMPLASVDETVDILKSQLVMLTLVLLITSLFISFILSKNLADPLSEISHQAENYSKGDFNLRLVPKSDDEIGKLVHRMNDMGDALARNERLQKELIANVSHELRTPLTLIRGYAETLRDVTGENKVKREKQLDIIIEESKRLGTIVEDILNLSGLQSGTKALNMAPFSLMDMLTNIKDHFESTENGIQINLIGVDALDGNLSGDPDKIQQVFYNLIGNALRHSKHHQIIDILVKPNKKSIRIVVKDYGEGISDVDLPHVFDRYYKGIRADGKKTEGSGLGLAIVKTILDLHEVPFGVESEIGVGTQFWFELNKENTHISF